jgi:hypothetical protein
MNASDGFAPAKIARRGRVADPPGKCNEVLTIVGERLAWCPKPQDRRSPDSRPRCADHLDAAEHPETNQT